MATHLMNLIKYIAPSCPHGARMAGGGGEGGLRGRGGGRVGGRDEVKRRGQAVRATG